MPGVTFYSPSPDLPAFSACRLNSLRFPQMGTFNVYPTSHGQKLSSLLANISMLLRPGRIYATKKAPLTKCSSCSATSYPPRFTTDLAVFLMGNPKDFLSIMTYSPRKQYFVSAPSISACVLNFRVGMGATTNLLTKIKCFLSLGKIIVHPNLGALNKPSLRIVKKELFIFNIRLYRYTSITRA